MNRYCLALDLKDDETLIEQYDLWHQPENGWPEIRESIVSSGIIDMQIYRTGNRLFMIIETTDDFSHERKAQLDAADLRVRAWEKLMSQFQQPLPWAKKGEKWVLMKEIFKL